MKKQLILIGLVCIVSAAFLCGCTQLGNNENGNSAKTVNMSVRELYEDMAPPENLLSFNLLYNSLDDGDTLILQDTIPNISYDPTTQATSIKFEWSEEHNNGTLTQRTTLLIDGDITDEFQVGDEFKITVTIKHVVISSPYGEGELELEIFEEQWIGEDYFLDNFATGGLRPLSRQYIEKL